MIFRSFFAAFLLSLAFSAPVYSKSLDFVEQQKMISHLMVNLFMDQINNNDLELMGHRINQSDIHPKEVSFKYHMDNELLGVDIYNELSKPLSVPGQPGMHIKGFTVTMDNEGNIHEVVAHLSN